MWRFGCAVVAHQGRIYVGGGFGQDKAILCSVECYDPDTDKVCYLLSHVSPSLSLFSGQSCRTWRRFVGLSEEFWWTGRSIWTLIRTSEWGRQSKAFLPVSDNTTHTDLSFLFIQSIVGISGIYWYVLLIFTETTIIWYEAFTKPRIGK